MESVLAKLELPTEGDGMHIGPDNRIHIVHRGKPACGVAGALERVEIAVHGLKVAGTGSPATFRRKCVACVRKQEAYWSGQ